MKKTLVFLLVLCLVPACRTLDRSQRAGDAGFSPAPCAKSLLSALAGSADRIFLDQLKDLEFLASTREVRSGEWDAMEPLLAAYQKAHPGLFLFYVRPDGSYFSANEGLTGKNLASRPYFPGLMAGNPVVGDLVVGRVTGRKSAVVGAPVTVSGQVIGAVGASIFLEELNNEMAGILSLPENMLFFALAPDGCTALNTVSERLMVDPRSVNDPELTRGKEAILKEKQGQVRYTLNGIPRNVVFCTSQLTGWHFAIGVKE